MDDQLKTDIEDHFHAEYLEVVKSEKKGFWKAFENFNDKAEAFFGKYNLSFGGVSVLGAVALFAAGPVAGGIALGAVVFNLGASVATAINDNAKATLAVNRDIENGILPVRYQDALDDKIKALDETIELYKTQKAALPAKGQASAAFTVAVTPANENEAPAPAPKVALQPKP